MKSPELIVRDEGNQATGTVRITDASVRAGIAQYDVLHPQSDYLRTEDRSYVQTWLQDDTYTHAIRREGRCYPPKEILRLAIGTGLQLGHQIAGGSTSGSAVSVLEELGFEVVSKRECPVAAQAAERWAEICRSRRLPRTRS